MAHAISGTMRDGSLHDAADCKGYVIIEWNRGGKFPPNTVIPGCLTMIREVGTERLIPAAKITVHNPASGMITADVALFLDDRGEIIYDFMTVAKSDAAPATFTFIVSEMRIL